MDDRTVGPGGDSAEGRPESGIAGTIVEDLQTIVRAEVRLAAAELGDKVRQGAKSGPALGAAGVLGFLSAAVLVTVCVAALTIVMPLWLSALLMGVVLALGAAGAYTLGRLALEEVDPVPQQTLETIKDNVDWARTRLQ